MEVVVHRWLFACDSAWSCHRLVHRDRFHWHYHIFNVQVAVIMILTADEINLILWVIGRPIVHQFILLLLLLLLRDLEERVLLGSWESLEIIDWFALNSERFELREILRGVFESQCLRCLIIAKVLHVWLLLLVISRLLSVSMFVGVMVLRHLQGFIDQSASLNFETCDGVIDLLLLENGVWSVRLLEVRSVQMRTQQLYLKLQLQLSVEWPELCPWKFQGLPICKVFSEVSSTGESLCVLELIMQGLEVKVIDELLDVWNVVAVHCVVVHVIFLLVAIQIRNFPYVVVRVRVLRLLRWFPLRLNDVFWIWTVGYCEWWSWFLLLSDFEGLLEIVKRRRVHKPSLAHVVEDFFTRLCLSDIRFLVTFH